jgi:hypothetical protein
MNRVHVPLSPFDPLAGAVVFAPERNEEGYWVGSPGVLHDGGQFWLTYRQRRPRGAEAERGWRCAVAKSKDGLHFDDVWQVRKHELNTPSMERFCLLPKAGGGYRLYISYVDPSDNRWRIDAVEATGPERFDIRARTPVLTAASTGTEGVKDPYIVQTGPAFHLFASYAAARDDLSPEAHATADVFNVGATTHPTGYATSLDGIHFDWRGTALEVGTAWDRYQARLTSIVPVCGGYIGFYDGSAGKHENYEERCGIAISSDLSSWRSLSTTKPWLASPHAAGSVRYVEAIVLDEEWWIYYEMTRPDGAHELRLMRLPPA